MTRNYSDMVDMTLHIDSSLTHAVELLVKRGDDELAAVALTAQEAFEVADLLQRHAHLYTSHVESLVSRDTILASFVAAPAMVQ